MEKLVKMLEVAIREIVMRVKVISYNVTGESEEVTGFKQGDVCRHIVLEIDVVKIGLVWRHG